MKREPRAKEEEYVRVFTTAAAFKINVTAAEAEGTLETTETIEELVAGIRDAIREGKPLPDEAGDRVLIELASVVACTYEPVAAYEGGQDG